MRPSNRQKILEAAVTLIELNGATGITLEAVAEEAGLTKGGLMYHFQTRDALLQGIHEYLAEQWEKSLVQVAGQSAESATVNERLEAVMHFGGDVVRWSA